ncbi:hypothetical protein N337_13015, partial [Phoenicopterus ruber ruber]
LKEYKVCPSPLGMTWAYSNWQNPNAVTERITMMVKEKKLRPGKGKAVICAILGAALVAAQESKKADDEMVKSLQEQINTLQSQLTAKRDTTRLLRVTLSDALDREKNLPSELEEKEQGSDFGSVTDSEPAFTSLAWLAGKQNQKSEYPFGELEISRKTFYPETEEAATRARIKTEATDNGQAGAALQVATQTVPYSATELSEIQEKYSRLAQETETEYVWRVSLMGRDRVLLSEDEAQGYWGPSVFLTTDDQREPWSLTQRAAYWAGGLDPLERGDPVSIETPNINQLTESLQKVSCLQLMHDRRLVPKQPSPMLLNANPDRMTPLIQGLPDSLKVYAIQLQDHLRDTLAPCRGRQAWGRSPMTWRVVAQELINYGRRIGLTGGATKSRTAGWRVEQWGNRPLHPRASGVKRNLLWAEGVEKGIPRDLMDGMPTVALEKLIQTW